MQNHVTLGGASSCLQLYFELVGGRIAIGYCGNHLPCVTSGT